MTRVCLVGSPDVSLQYELLSRETSREALSTYDLARPFENSLSVRTVSLGAAVSLCNDLQWYLVRFVDEVLIQEPSVSDDEWLSRDLAVALRNGDLQPAETGEHLKIFGLERAEAPGLETSTGDGGKPDDRQRATDTRNDEPGGGDERATDDDSISGPAQATTRLAGNGAEPGGPPKLVEPLYVRRTDGEMPTYDLRDVEETLIVRLTESEFSP
ncbi:DUF5804 family protein [Natronosalvus halobius]|uniref:DUF5804 family protein n=1 Tax=Natronosalvus halobius TaxID=2953746 RepID=UPI00209F484A|nr:DUF5804 family protein [Natronosalvus halobius]USZ73471.1 DUF5804 family protein [Natronosalvus halobius]